MNKTTDINFSAYMSVAQKNNECALRCEEIIRSCILEAGYDSGLLLRSVAHQLIIYVSSFILRHENMDYEVSTANFPYLPGRYWQSQTITKFNRKKYNPVYSYSFKRKCFVELSATYKVPFWLRIINRFWTFFYSSWLPSNEASTTSSDLKEKYTSGQVILRRCIKLLVVEIGLTQDEAIFEKNFISFVDSYIAFFSGVNTNALYSGTLCKIQSSARAFAYRCDKLPVTVEDHGDFSIILHDEPVATISELGLCSSFRTYGEMSWISELLENNKKKISQPEIKIIKNNIKIVENHKLLANKIRSSRARRLLYIPTAFSSYFRYLPFRDYSDEVYLGWQEVLLKKLLELGYIVDYKSHPKSKVNFFIGESSIISQNLYDVDIEVYDAIVLDFVSTAFSQALNSSVPVWFFDIGLRKMHSYFYDHFSNRGIKPIDFNNELSEQIEEICRTYEQEDKMDRVRLW